MTINETTLEQTLAALRARLLQSRTPQGYWQGQLSSSALSTATAVFALTQADKNKYHHLISKGLDWLASHHNPDGGWGDTVLSSSNISTTMLCWAAFTAADDPKRFQNTIAHTRSWLINHAGSLEPEPLVKAICRKYGKDYTFSVPILTMCALGGVLSDTGSPWRFIKPLPFELAACPRRLFKWLRLSVVSYALPALIAIGQVSYHYRKPKNPLVRLFRYLTKRRTLSVLKNIQPTNGGFLEAIPLTSFVVMSLVSMDQKDNDIVSRSCQFIVDSVRDDGSWPIDTNLATWVTTLSVKALATYSDLGDTLSIQDRKNIKHWLLAQQYRTEHPYTQSPPGGWAWTNLPGGVPDADDTAGALIALRKLDLVDKDTLDAVVAGVNWLLELQNRDGGFPTFCQGWSILEFDRSAPDLTAHALAAFTCWGDLLPHHLANQIDRKIQRAIKYLADAQNDDGSWIPLWFGNEHTPAQQNPVYGTAVVLNNLRQLPKKYILQAEPIIQKAISWLLTNQNSDGTWGGTSSTHSSIEETSVASTALAGWLYALGENSKLKDKFNLPIGPMESALTSSVNWLIEKTDPPIPITPAPIGLYFAKLWYYESLYPLIFTISALGTVQKLLSKRL